MPARRYHTPYLILALMIIVKPWEAPYSSWWRLLDARLRHHKLLFVDILLSCDSVKIGEVYAMLFLCCFIFVFTVRLIFWKIFNLPSWVVLAIFGMLILWPHLPDFCTTFLEFVIVFGIGAATFGLVVQLFLGIPVWVTVATLFVIAAYQKALPVVTSVWSFVVDHSPIWMGLLGLMAAVAGIVIIYLDRRQADSEPTEMVSQDRDDD